MEAGGVVCHEILAAGFPIPPGVDRVTVHETFGATAASPHIAARFVGKQLADADPEATAAATSLVEELVAAAGEQMAAAVTVSVSRSAHTVLIALLAGDTAIPAEVAPDALRSRAPAVYVVAAFGADGKAMWFTLPLA